jgi:hypothetical protein
MRFALPLLMLTTVVDHLWRTLLSRRLRRSLCAEYAPALAPAKVCFALVAGDDEVLSTTTGSDASGGPLVTGTAEPMIEEGPLR